MVGYSHLRHYIVLLFLSDFNSYKSSYPQCCSLVLIQLLPSGSQSKLIMCLETAASLWWGSWFLLWGDCRRLSCCSAESILSRKSSAKGSEIGICCFSYRVALSVSFSSICQCFFTRGKGRRRPSAGVGRTWGRPALRLQARLQHVFLPKLPLIELVLTSFTEDMQRHRARQPLQESEIHPAVNSY